MKLSDNERMVLDTFNSDATKFSNFTDGIATESWTYGSDLADDIASILEVEAKSAKGIVSSMIRKGIFVSKETAIDDEGHERDKIVALTDAGVETISDLRLELEEIMLEVEIEDEEDEDAHTPEAANKRIKKARAKDTDDLRQAAQDDIKEGKPSLRTSHAGCSHATQGKEGKIARAKCRRDRAAAAAKAAEGKKAKVSA